MIQYKKYILLDIYETNTYLVWDNESKEAILIDPAAPNRDLTNEIKSLNLKLLKIINTHGHGDHIGGNEYFQKEFNCEICIHSEDAPMLVNPSLNLSALMNLDLKTPNAGELFKDKDTFKLRENIVEIIHTPGHTKGGIVIYAAPYLFTGDTIFYLSVGRTDLPGGDTDKLVSSIKDKIFTLPKDTIILPGHGPASKVGFEIENNPYVD